MAEADCELRSNHAAKAEDSDSSQHRAATITYVDRRRKAMPSRDLA